MPGTDPRSLVSHRGVPETCGACHGEILTLFRDSIHGEAAAGGMREAPVCTDCHGEHRILGHTEPTFPLFVANVPGETCGRCHASTRLSEEYGLPLEKVTTFEDSYHGLALRAGQLSVANCATYHGVHDIRPSSDPRSHVHKTNLVETCRKCHPGAGSAFELGTVHVLPLVDGAWLAYWIRLIYLWLIVLTVGFMAAHNLLDLIKKACWREPIPRPAFDDRPERMPCVLRWQHGLVMVSFPVLVYTGFALTYPESW